MLLMLQSHYLVNMPELGWNGPDAASVGTVPAHNGMFTGLYLAKI